MWSKIFIRATITNIAGAYEAKIFYSYYYLYEYSTSCVFETKEQAQTYILKERCHQLIYEYWKFIFFFTLYMDNYQFNLIISCCCRTSPLSMCVIYNSNNRYKIVNAFERRIYHNTNDGKYYQVYISYCTRCVIPIEFINGETSQDFNNFDCMIEIYQP